MKVQVKARYFLRGFKKHNKPRYDSPTADRCSNRLLYHIAGNKCWNIELSDVTFIFIQGAETDCTIFLTPPKAAGCSLFGWLRISGCILEPDAAPAHKDVTLIQS